MALQNSEINVEQLILNSFETFEDYYYAYNNNLISGNEISLISEAFQADWNQNDKSQPDFIRNKPFTGISQIDSGSVLTVNSSGNYEWVQIIDSETIYY